MRRARTAMRSATACGLVGRSRPGEEPLGVELLLAAGCRPKPGRRGPDRRAPADGGSRRRRGARPGEHARVGSTSIGIATGSRSDSATAGGSSRSEIGKMVDDVGPPVRALTSVASRTRESGRRRATTMWSAPVPTPSSSTIASMMWSGEIDRDSPWRILAKLSASARRLLSRVLDGEAVPDGREADDGDQRDDDPAGPRRRGRDPQPATNPRTKKEPAKKRQERRIRRSSALSPRPGWSGDVTCGPEHDGWVGAASSDQGGT